MIRHKVANLGLIEPSSWFLTPHECVFPLYGGGFFKAVGGSGNQPTINPRLSSICALIIVSIRKSWPELVMMNNLNLMDRKMKSKVP